MVALDASSVARQGTTAFVVLLASGVTNRTEIDDVPWRKQLQSRVEARRQILGEAKRCVDDTAQRVDLRMGRCCVLVLVFMRHEHQNSKAVLTSRAGIGVTPARHHAGMHVNRFKITVEGELRVETANSLWLIRHGEYFRMPLVESPRPPAPSMDGALDDHRWMPYVSLSVSRSAGYGDQLWILPAGRPAGSQGLHTGVVVNAEPALDDLRDEWPDL